jgi:hypothetical protein
MHRLTEDEALDLIVKAASPRVGKRAKMKRNLVYARTALGMTLIPVDIEEEDESESIND